MKQERAQLEQEVAAFREDRLQKVEEAMAVKAVDTQAVAEQAEKEEGRHPRLPSAKSQRNFIYPEFIIMPKAGGKDFGQVYNCQEVVDGAQQVIETGPAAVQSSDKP